MSTLPWRRAVVPQASAATKVLQSRPQLNAPGIAADDNGILYIADTGNNRIRQVTADAGFTRFRRAAQTPFNLVFEVRP